MKKHFLLFITSFITFQAFIIVGSSVSRGMITPECDEATRSIVLYNSQGQKTRKIPFHWEHPAADNRFQRYGKASIMILLGTSTAGKTTLINSIRMKHPVIKDYSHDLILDKAERNIIKTLFPEEYNILNVVVPYEDIVNVCYGDKIRAGNYSSEQLQLAEQTAQKIGNMLDFNDQDYQRWLDRGTDHLILDSMNGIPIILDCVEIEEIGQIFSKNFYADVHIMITFCPLKELSKRLIKRNKEAERSQQPSDIRGEFFLWQFTELYKRRETRQEPLLQILTRNESITVFRLHATKPELEETFLRSLGFTSPEIDTVEITTRAPYYHSIFNTKVRGYSSKCQW